jgi:sugar lactone lactonase YvrE
MLKTIVLLCFATLLASCQSSESAFQATRQNDFISTDSKLQELWADGVFTEGPTIDHEGNVLFTDIRINHIKKFNIQTGKVSIYKENSNGTNGLFFQQDSLYSCEGAGHQLTSVAKTDLSGKKEILASHWQGQKLNSPNDLYIAQNGDLYFTDPRYGSAKGKELNFEGVFCIRNKELILATNETERPNGILISHDGKHAFVADNNNSENGARDLLKFAINNDGTFSHKEILFSFQPHQRGIDGMTMDSEGNIYATSGKGAESGIYIFSQSGANLAFIQLPEKPTNCTFGGPTEKNTLYITCQARRQPHVNQKFGLFKIELKKSGLKR